MRFCQTLVLNPCFARRGTRYTKRPASDDLSYFFPLSCLPCSAFPLSQQEQKHPNKPFVYACLRLSSEVRPKLVSGPILVQIRSDFRVCFAWLWVRFWSEFGPLLVHISGDILSAVFTPFFLCGRVRKTARSRSIERYKSGHKMLVLLPLL